MSEPAADPSYVKATTAAAKWQDAEEGRVSAKACAQQGRPLAKPWLFKACPPCWLTRTVGPHVQHLTDFSSNLEL